MFDVKDGLTRRSPQPKRFASPASLLHSKVEEEDEDEDEEDEGQVSCSKRSISLVSIA
jgi:hypothetical protein